MHELSIATTIVEDVLAFAERQGAAKIVRVRLAIGELTCVQSEQLKFCYESITRETPLAGSELQIENTLARVACSRCGYEGSPKYWTESLAGAPVPTLECPACGSCAEALEGHDCAIKSVQYAA